MITAKVFCNSKTEFGTGAHKMATIGFCPDYGNGRNAEWAASTPHLDLRMTVKADVADQFEMSDPFTLTFTPEPKQTEK